jgi:hypothetical protein
MTGAMILIGLLGGLGAFGLAAWRWGTDTTDAFVILDRDGRRL